MYSRRTPADLARGQSEHTFTVFVFEPQVGPFFKARNLPKTAALFQDVADEIKKVSVVAKETWNRPRPFVADPTRFSQPGDTVANASYPSGHSMQGTVFAMLLGEIFPDRREVLLAKARLIGWTRVEIGVHTPLDIYAGRVLGKSLAQSFLENPAFRRDLAEAKAEADAARRAVHPAPAGVP